jgi:transposase
MCASLKDKKRALLSATNTQQDLFDHSVLEHEVTANLLCIYRAPTVKRCMMESVKVRKTYSQEWSAYNQAQTNEKSKFQELLFELCRNIEEPMQHMGRPRVPLADRLFACCFKVYSMMSGRRFTSDLQEAKRRGYLSQMPHYNSIFRYLEGEDLTAILKHLIAESSLPLKAIESDFAVDSSGFATAKTVSWMHQKYSKPHFVDKADWVKVHLMCGVRTNIVTSVEITDRHAGDSPQFPTLVDATAKNFRLGTVVADKAYLSATNLRVVSDKAGVAYIPFKSNSNAEHYTKDPLWKTMYHQFMANRSIFMLHYHKRSNVETTFSMIKAKFGERLKSKTTVAQTNEVLCKVLCHNLCCVIQSMYELGIEPNFGLNSL